MQNISLDKLAQTISDSLSEWESDKWKKVEQLAEEKGKELQERVIDDAPVLTGVYKKGFKIKKEKDYRKVKMTVYNTSKRKSLMHLLEDGHAKADGGRVQGKPHLRKNEQEVNNEFIKEVQVIYESK